MQKTKFKEIGKMTHNLKILPCYFQAVVSGDKKFEIRNDSDRGFQKGDLVMLNEWSEGKFTGNSVMVEITYVTGFEQKQNFVVFGFFIIE
ncbi:hypothetical protein vBVpPvVp04M_00062 [Vibrio phage vB_Vp_PvVp04_M]|nr:hypothetical protein vBVpPvVp04M_00062 [Vibrio phage vB_Vp_PvVp04_M]